MKIEKEKVYVRASKQVRGWLGAQVKGKAKEDIWVEGTVNAKVGGVPVRVAGEQ